MLHDFGSVPVQAPVQPPKIDPAEGPAARETAVPGNTSDEQLPLAHVIDPSPDVTVPVPAPATVTLSVTPRTIVAVTVLFESMVTEQPRLVGAPEQAPPQL